MGWRRGRGHLSSPVPGICREDFPGEEEGESIASVCGQGWEDERGAACSVRLANSPEAARRTAGYRFPSQHLESPRPMLTTPSLTTPSFTALGENQDSKSAPGIARSAALHPTETSGKSGVDFGRAWC